MIPIGLISGVVAGIVFVMFEMIVAAIIGNGFFAPLRMIAATALRNDADQLVSEDPPPSRSQLYRWAQMVEELRQHPGRWARLLGEHTEGVRGSLRKRGLDVTCRVIVNGSNSKGLVRVLVWARWPKEGQPGLANRRPTDLEALRRA